jgi:hypothetical protein
VAMDVVATSIAAVSSSEVAEDEDADGWGG